jgi:hypothetical protein
MHLQLQQSHREAARSAYLMVSEAVVRVGAAGAAMAVMGEAWEL